MTQVEMRDSNTERIGIYKTALIFTEEIKWVFREQPIVDVGIDALIEQSIDGNPTGQFIAAQIKTGEGNFYIKENYLTYYVSNIHYNYWLNFNVPVILVGYIPDDKKTYWENITEKNLQKTEKQWKIIISKTKELGENSIKELNSIIDGNESNNFLIELGNGSISNVELQKIIEELESSKFFREATSNIVALITLLGEKTTENKIKIDQYAVKGATEFDKRVLSTLKKYAEMIDYISSKLNDEIDVFSFHYARGIYAYEKATLMNFCITKNDNKLTETCENLKPIILSISSAIEGLATMQNSISNLPSKYAHLKKARSRFTKTTTQIITEFEVAKTITSNLIASIEKMVN